MLKRKKVKIVAHENYQLLHGKDVLGKWQRSGTNDVHGAVCIGKVIKK